MITPVRARTARKHLGNDESRSESAVTGHHRPAQPRAGTPASTPPPAEPAPARLMDSTDRAHRPAATAGPASNIQPADHQRRGDVGQLQETEVGIRYWVDARTRRR